MIQSFSAGGEDVVGRNRAKEDENMGRNIRQ